MSQPNVELRHLVKVFPKNPLDSMDKNKKLTADDRVAVDDVSLLFEKGERVGIIGRNGAGKSTLLSIIAGLTSKTKGEVHIEGKVTAVMTIGVGLREDLTGLENIYLDGELQGKSRDEVNLVMDEIVRFAELDEFIDKPVKTYSTGMKSRLAFSMLVGLSPEILIIDEALSAGDVFFAKKATQTIQEICDKGKIVLIVSHSMNAINDMCNRCIWLDKGKVLMDGEPKAVTQAYLKTVRAEDEAKGLNTYQKPLSYTIDTAGYVVLDVALRKRGEAQAQTVFHTKDPFELEISLSCRRDRQAHLEIIIERLDGLLVSSEKFSLSGGLTMLFSLDSLVLNRGYYQVKVVINEEEQVTNQFIRFFEVKNHEAASGGLSLLHYPAQITLVSEEV